ncbi:hypothetical protein [Bacillus toyonensis]|uniref:hypothetical protein n=1 Tax=Bacillus toyonensis TaxID=155322 RepID=UPI000BF8354D|nr:hypothetical protein [Bacillus toyonensis]PGF05174.1 hypothetical protein COM61_01765 [Bacillus toyonensis]
MSERVYPDHYYMRATEKIIDREGTTGYYSRFVATNEIYGYVVESYRVKTKKELLEKVEEILARHLGKLDEYTRIETPYGWKYELYVHWFNDDMDYRVTDKDGDWTHHETFNVDISLFEEVHNPMSKLG